MSNTINACTANSTKFRISGNSISKTVTSWYNKSALTIMAFKISGSVLISNEQRKCVSVAARISGC